jgi:hypothetical protein
VPIKVLIKRQFKKEHVNEIKTMLKEVRYDAMCYVARPRASVVSRSMA